MSNTYRIVPAFFADGAVTDGIAVHPWRRHREVNRKQQRQHAKRATVAALREMAEEREADALESLIVDGCYEHFGDDWAGYDDDWRDYEEESSPYDYYDDGPWGYDPFDDVWRDDYVSDADLAELARSAGLPATESNVSSRIDAARVITASDAGRTLGEILGEALRRA